jgi:NhaP-type Na+/H+ and K+/H+ antiporter
MFASFTAIITAIKNYRKFIFVGLAALIVIGGLAQQGRIAYYKHQVLKLEAEKNAVSIARMNTVIQESTDHVVRIAKIDKETANITEQINKLKKGKIHEKEYYDTAESIANRFNNGLQ